MSVDLDNSLPEQATDPDWVAAYPAKAAYALDYAHREIASLRQEVETLQEALRPIAAKVTEIEEIARDVDAEPDDIGVGVSYAECLAARALLTRPKQLEITVEWQPIETAPRDGTEIDIWIRLYRADGTVEGDRVPDARWGDDVMDEGPKWIDHERNPVEWEHSGRRSVATHWRFLTEPPPGEAYTRRGAALHWSSTLSAATREA